MISWQVAIFAVLAAVLVGGFAWYERSRPPSQIVALVAALAALAVAGRVVLAPIPNVVATTDIVIFSGYALGGAPGFAVGALAGVVSNFWLGQGPWTPWQMAGWGLAGVLGALLARGRGRRIGRWELAVVCGLAGIAYGALLNFSLMVSYGGELTMDRFLALEARAVPFDVAHAAGNVTLALVAGPVMIRMLVRFRERFEFSWQPVEGRRRRIAPAGVAMLMICALVAGAALPLPRAEAASTTAWLERVQNIDGGFPADPGQESSAEMTGWAMLGLEAAGTNPVDVTRRGRSPLDYLRRNVGDLRTVGDLARTILALEGAGVDAGRFAGRDLVTRLAGRQRADGSFQGWPGTTAYSVMALRTAGAPGSGRGRAWLRRVQNHDGGWSAVPDAQSDPDSTGAALQALGAKSKTARRGVRYLRRTQRPSGGWALAEGGPVNSQSTAWALQGLLAVGLEPQSVRRGGRDGLDFLAARRAGDGHYRYSSSSDQTPVWVTGQALAAAHRQPFPIAVVPAAEETSANSKSRDGSTRGPAPSGGDAQGGEATRQARGENGAKAPPDTGSPAGGEADRTPTESEPENRPGVTTTAERPSEGEDDDSPLIPIGIGVGAAALVLGGIWWLARRRLW